MGGHLGRATGARAKTLKTHAGAVVVGRDMDSGHLSWARFWSSVTRAEHWLSAIVLQQKQAQLFAHFKFSTAGMSAGGLMPGNSGGVISHVGYGNSWYAAVRSRVGIERAQDFGFHSTCGDQL